MKPALLQTLDPAGRYVRDADLGFPPQRPAGLQPYPYFSPGWSPSVMESSRAIAPHQHPTATAPTFGATNDETAALVTKLVMLAFLGWLLWMAFGKRRSNPGKLARVYRRSSGWYYRLRRKRAKAHGPYATRDEAIEAVEARGYSAMV